MNRAAAKRLGVFYEERFLAEKASLEVHRLIARFSPIAANALPPRHYFDGTPHPEIRRREYPAAIRPDKACNPEESHLLAPCSSSTPSIPATTHLCLPRHVPPPGTDTRAAIAGAVGSLKGLAARRRECCHADVGRYPRPRRQSSLPDASALFRSSDTARALPGKITAWATRSYTMSDPRAVVIKKYAAALASRHC